MSLAKKIFSVRFRYSLLNYDDFLVVLLFSLKLLLNKEFKSFIKCSAFYFNGLGYFIFPFIISFCLKTFWSIFYVELKGKLKYCTYCFFKFRLVSFFEFPVYKPKEVYNKNVVIMISLLLYYKTLILFY